MKRWWNSDGRNLFKIQLRWKAENCGLVFSFRIEKTLNTDRKSSNRSTHWATAQYRSTSDQKVAGSNSGSPGAELSYVLKYTRARCWTPKLLLICSWHLVFQPLPSVRALWWADTHPGCTLPSPIETTGIGSSNPVTPWKRGIKVVTSPRPSWTSGGKWD